MEDIPDNDGASLPKLFGLSVSAEPYAGRLRARRLFFASLVAATVLLIGWQAFLMSQSNGSSGLKIAILVIFVILLVPIAVSFWTTVLGFFVQLRGGDEFGVMANLDACPTSLGLSRTAILMPVYNEPTARVFAGVEAMFNSLAQTGFLEQFDFFILSDTNDPDIWVKEELAFADLRHRLDRPEHLKYRNRRENIERKVGNIAEFCAKWGARYDYMIVLDADSIMTGACMVNLVRLMEGHPRVGLIQAPPLPVNRRTLFGRLYQFAMHAYNRNFVAGLNFWEGGSANYWGHNAIVRVQPFMEHCQLPKLPGKPPLGGSILSHDTVEAALMRRAGYLVCLAPDMPGSYEELPSSLLNYAARDRRWCQGNLQHSRLLRTPGFHAVNRIQMALGILHYLSSPLWLLILPLTTFEAIQEKLTWKPLETDGFINLPGQSIHLLLVMLALLLVPKLLSFLTAGQGRSFGGPVRFAGSVLAEVLGSALLAPTLALLQTRFVVGILMGRNIGWNAQHRGEPATTLSEALLHHWLATALGLGWILLCVLTVPKLLWWFSPVIVGWLAAIPVSMWTSHTTPGEWSCRKGLFLIPDEVSPPEILEQLHRNLQYMEAQPWAQVQDGLAYVLENPGACEMHLARLAPAQALKALEAKVLDLGIQSLTPQEKRQLLLSAESLLRFSKQLHLDLASGQPIAHNPRSDAVVF